MFLLSHQLFCVHKPHTKNIHVHNDLIVKKLQMQQQQQQQQLTRKNPKSLASHHYKQKPLNIHTTILIQIIINNCRL